MCVASASPPDLIHAALNKFKMLDFFEFICSTEDGFADKRSPDIFLYCAERFGAEPAEIAVFEDSLSAVKSAKAAGFHIIAVYDKTSEKYQEEIKSLADRFLPTEFIL